MKKTTVTFLVAGLFTVSAVRAQSIQDGVKDLYSERYKSAKSVFEKLVASNPNNIEATYWLGQTYIEMDDTAGAKNVYSKALQSSANAPLVIVGMGQVELMENKLSEARQRFEAAITMTRGKKGDDPAILNAVGRAISNTYNAKEKKGGDINYAVSKLEAATQRDPKNADILLNLGNAYRKAKPGEAGGAAFQSYQKATVADPNFAPAYHRMAQLFNTQRNWDLYEKYLNDAIEKDPRYAPAYYDLSYYKMGKLDFTAAEEYARKYSENSDPDPSNEYLRASILYFQKKYDESLNLAKSIITRSGDKPNAKLYKLIAYNLLDKKDTAAAKEFVDLYFANEKPDEMEPMDYQMKASAYSVIPGQEAVVLESYKEGIKADSVLENKINLLKKGTAFFAAKKDYVNEAQLQQLILETKPNLTINDYFAAGIANYRAEQHAKSYEIFKLVSEKFPDQQFGWEWKFNNASLIDTVKKDSIAVPDALQLIEFAKKDTVKFKKLYVDAAGFLVDYYANHVNDYGKAADYVRQMLSIDPANPRAESWRGILTQIEKMKSRPASKQQPAKTSSQPRSSASGATNKKPTEG